MLATVNPPSYRKKVAREWMLWNENKCDYARQVYISNHGPLTLGTAWDREIEYLTWALKSVEAPRTQAITQKRRL